MRFLILCIVLSGNYYRISGEDVPEFQFPCFVDVCTFPRQFCNSDKYERRCSPCSRALCRASDIPSACRYLCMKYEEEGKTTPQSTMTTNSIAQQSNHDSGNMSSLYLIMAYSAVTTTLIVVVLLLFIAYYIHRKKLGKQRSGTADKNVKNENIEMGDIRKDTCTSCKRPSPELEHRNIDSMAGQKMNIQPSNPPSYRTQDNSSGQTCEHHSSTSSGIEESQQSCSPSLHKNYQSADNYVKPESEKLLPKVINTNSNDLNCEYCSLLSKDENEETSLKSKHSCNT